MKFRNFLMIFFLVFYLFYSGLMIYAMVELGIDKWTALFGGIINGVMLKMLSDGWQFYFRKKPDNEDSNTTSNPK